MIPSVIDEQVQRATSRKETVRKLIDRYRIERIELLLLTLGMPRSAA
jgi:hypothetical protein